MNPSPEHPAESSQSSAPDPHPSDDAMNWGWRLVCTLIIVQLVGLLSGYNPMRLGLPWAFSIAVALLLWLCTGWLLFVDRDVRAATLGAILSIGYGIEVFPIALPPNVVQIAATVLLVITAGLFLVPRKTPVFATNPRTAKKFIALAFLLLAMAPLVRIALKPAEPKSIFDKDLAK